jgi:hypothetical protein
MLKSIDDNTVIWKDIQWYRKLSAGNQDRFLKINNVINMDTDVSRVYKRQG